MMALLSALAACLAQAPQASLPERPNIVLAIADDLDPDHPGFCGNPLARTPALDRLAAEGAYFPSLYVQPVCRASLAVLLSGRWPHESGVLNNGTRRSLDPAGALPRLLAERGYRSYCAGKFWEGDPPSYGFEAPPKSDEGFARKSDQADLFRFLEDARDGPWFVWWAPSLPHVPHQPPERHARPFASAEIPVPAGIRGDADDYVAAERDCLAMVSWLDEEFARLVAKLEELGEREETVILFLSDNGWCTAKPSKGSPREKGIRSPLVVSAPGRSGGTRLEDLVALPDVHATVLDYAGALPAASRGLSLRPLLEGRAHQPRAVVCGAAYSRHGAGGVESMVYALFARDERWKYVLYLADVSSVNIPAGSPHAPIFQRRAGTQELFDLRDDPLEERDLSAREEHDERKHALRSAVESWWRESGGWALDLPAEPGR